MSIILDVSRFFSHLQASMVSKIDHIHCGRGSHIWKNTNWDGPKDNDNDMPYMYCRGLTPPWSRCANYSVLIPKKLTKVSQLKYQIMCLMEPQWQWFHKNTLAKEVEGSQRVGKSPTMKEKREEKALYKVSMTQYMVQRK